MIFWIWTYGIMGLVTAILWAVYEGAHTRQYDLNQKRLRLLQNHRNVEASHVLARINELSRLWHFVKPYLIALCVLGLLIGSLLPHMYWYQHVQIWPLFHSIWWVVFNPSIAIARGAKWSHLSDSGVDKWLKVLSDKTKVHHFIFKLVYLFGTLLLAINTT